MNFENFEKLSENDLKNIKGGNGEVEEIELAVEEIIRKPSGTQISGSGKVGN